MMGFAFQRKAGDGPFEYLKGMKVFPSLAPKDDDNKIQYFTTDKKSDPKLPVVRLRG